MIYGTWKVKAKSMIFLDWKIEENLCDPETGKTHGQLEKKW